MNLAYSTPDWLQNLNASPLKLGLDLRGGIYFLLEVDTDNEILNGFERKEVHDVKVEFLDMYIDHVDANLSKYFKKEFILNTSLIVEILVYMG